MATIKEQLESILESKLAIKNVLIAKGVNMTGVKFNEYANKISAIGRSGYITDNLQLALQNIGWDNTDIETLKQHVWWRAKDNDSYNITVEEYDNGYDISKENGISLHEFRQNDYYNVFASRFAPKLNMEQTSFEGAFMGMSAIEAMPSFVAVPAVTLADAFNGCHNLKYIPYINLSGTSNLNRCFKECYSLEFADIDASIASTCNEMFSCCYNLNTVSFTKNNLTSADEMFKNCYHLHTVEGLDFNKVTSCTDIFSGCEMLTNCCINNLDTNISFVDSKHLTKDSLLYMITHAKGENSISITISRDRYDLIYDAECQAAVDESGGKLIVIKQ